MIAIIVISKRGAKTNRFPAGIGHSAVDKEQTPYFKDSHQYHHKNWQNERKFNNGLCALCARSRRFLVSIVNFHVLYSSL